MCVCIKNKTECIFERANRLLYTVTDLTARNWQKWKQVFLTCPCHRIYRIEAVSLKNSNNALKRRFLWICEIWSNRYFVKIESENSVAHMLHVLIWLWLSSAQQIRLYLSLIDFSYIQIFFPNLAFSSVKSPNVIRRSVSHKNAFKKSKNPLPFLCKSVGSNKILLL